jgi:hypothetical protein
VLELSARELARREDPPESHAGAEYVEGDRLGELQAEALAAVRRSPGLTAMELAARECPTDTRRIGRRLVELERRGDVRRGKGTCSITGRPAARWYAVPK